MTSLPAPMTWYEAARKVAEEERRNRTVPYAYFRYRQREREVERQGNASHEDLHQ